MSRPRVAACFSITMDAEVLDPPLGRVEAAQRSEGIDRAVAMVVAFRSREVLAVFPLIPEHPDSSRSTGNCLRFCSPV